VSPAESHTGLNDNEVIASRTQHGNNSISDEKTGILGQVVRDVITEPIFLLLVSTALLYIILGEWQEAIIMLIALAIVSCISLYQEQRSRSAIAALRSFTAAKVRAYRNGTETLLAQEDLVVGDIILLEDGDIIPADGMLLHSHDLSVNESLLTGESVPVYKTPASENNLVLRGTLVVAGACTAKVTAVGIHTDFGKLGRSLRQVETPKTPIQKQIRDFIRIMVLAGAIAFLIVCVMQYMLSGDFILSILQGLTLAMSILPEEIPVAFSTFMALGSFRLYKYNVIVKSPYTIETLGAATVICIDKTGTITENKMELHRIFDIADMRSHDLRALNPSTRIILEYAMWASETDPFDPMEKSIHHIYASNSEVDLRSTFKMVHEYPLDGSPPMMTHVFKYQDAYKIGCKGGPETVLSYCDCPAELKSLILLESEKLAAEGYRVLAVASAVYPEDGLPDTQQKFSFTLLGLLAFYDPLKKNIPEVLHAMYAAGLQVKMITGDASSTAQAIARKAGMQDPEKKLSGRDVMLMSDLELQQAVQETNVFARMHPDAKLRVVEVLKKNNEVIAMIGDGVNDAPALKAAHIGIAMGTKGTETAKKAASLILVDDDLSMLTEAVASGRRIYQNLKKAIRYIISIHIPIILIVMLPLVLGWKFADIFNPVHVIFLELIMGPTCSIVFEREPMEKFILRKGPRKSGKGFFHFRELQLSIIQGLCITTACLGMGYYFMQQGNSEIFVRTIVFTILIWSNLFLTLVNRSFHQSIFVTIRQHNPLIPLILSISLAIWTAAVYLQPARDIFSLTTLRPSEILLCVGTAMAGTLWIELLKSIRRKRNSSLFTAAR